MASSDLIELPSDLPIISILLICSLTYFIILVYNDYCAFLSLGPGGTPSNIGGYLRIKFLGCFKVRDPYKPTKVPHSLKPYNGCLSSLPKRQSPRPIVRGIAPHRQTSQMCRPEVFSILSRRIVALASHPQNRLRLGTSCFEKHGTGLFSVSPIRQTCGGEVCHTHASDGSMHMTLHPSDAAVVLSYGWGERHPLARGGWLSRFVPLTFVMVYAPRDENEVETVMNIIRAACWWVSGRRVYQPGSDEDVDNKNNKSALLNDGSSHNTTFVDSVRVL